MTKLYTIAGTSTFNGQSTYRFATGKANVRASKLKLNGHTDINLVDLPTPMSKADAVAWLNQQGSVAIMPKTGRTKAAPTEARLAREAERASKRAAREARRAARQPTPEVPVTAEDVAFVAGVQTAEVPAGISSTAAPNAADDTGELNELMELIGESAATDSNEVGVDADRELAAVAN